MQDFNLHFLKRLFSDSIEMFFFRLRIFSVRSLYYIILIVFLVLSHHPSREFEVINDIFRSGWIDCLYQY